MNQEQRDRFCEYTAIEHIDIEDWEEGDGNFEAGNAVIDSLGSEPEPSELLAKLRELYEQYHP